MRFSEATAMATSVVCRPSVRERSVTDHALIAADIRLHQGTPIVTRRPLPAHAAALGDQLQVLVALRRRGLCRGAWHRARTRRHNDRRSSPGFLLQRAYHVPAADILLAAAGAVDDWSA